MLMDIKCKAIESVMVDLTFDDGSEKERIISIGDLVDVTYNASGLRKQIQGKVINITVVGPDPKNWQIIVDGSDDFDSERARFSPMSILDVDIIRKGDTIEFVQTPIGDEGAYYIRIVKETLQYSKDGLNWSSIKIYSRDVVEEIENAEW